MIAKCLKNRSYTKKAGRKHGVLAAYSAYAAESFILKPILNPARTSKEEKYTTKLCQLRIDVEHGIGRLKRQWSLLHGELRYEPVVAGNIVIAACCLRNFVIQQGETGVWDEDTEESDDSDSDGDLDFGPGSERQQFIINNYF